MKIYIDSDYCCHTENPDGIFREVETNAFDGKCQTYIEGFRYIPIGESWVDPNGITIHGGYVAPWKPYAELDAAQREYERKLLTDYESALAEIEAALGVSV